MNEHEQDTTPEVTDQDLKRIRDIAARWIAFFQPYMDDDNEWYRRPAMDGKDAAEVGEAFSEILYLARPKVRQL